MINPFNNQKGVALIVTLAIVAILLAATLQLAKFTGDSVNVTQVEKDRFQAEQFALSGINVALMLLVEDAAKDNIDSVQETWADPDKLSQAIAALGLEKEPLTIKITDELSKIQVNALLSEFPGNRFNPDQVRIWENLLQLLLSSDNAMDKINPDDIINSIKDWLDSGDNDAVSGFSGAESDYYLGLDFPYACANGPFNHIDELLNVKGISIKLLSSENFDKTDEQSRGTMLSDVFTVYGLDSEKTGDNGFQYTGKVNINTAGIEVLAALLPEGKEYLARYLSDFRNQKNEQEDTFTNLLDANWYKRVIPLTQDEQSRLDRTIRYSSNIFKIESIGQKNDTKVILAAFVKREQDKASGKWACRTLQLERE